jgi:hypothetical protein
MDIFCGKQYRTAMLHVEKIEYAGKGQVVKDLVALFDGLESIMAEPESYDFESQISNGLQWHDRSTFCVGPKQTGEIYPSDTLRFWGLGLVVIESPLADMIECVHHVMEPDQLRETILHAVSLDQMLSKLVKHMNSCKTAEISQCKADYWFFTPVIEGERVVRIGEQTLLTSLESDLFGEDY